MTQRSFMSAGFIYRIMRALTRSFPVPQILMPPTAGIDISDASIKWLALTESADGYRVSTFGEVPIEAGVVESGIVKNVNALAHVLVDVRTRMGGITTAHAALPEEAAYVF